MNGCPDGQVPAGGAYGQSEAHDAGNAGVLARMAGEVCTPRLARQRRPLKIRRAPEAKKGLAIRRDYAIVGAF